MVALVARVHNYALKIPWAQTEAYLPCDPQYGLTAPGHIYFHCFLFPFQVPFPLALPDGLITVPFEGQIHQDDSKPGRRGEFLGGLFNDHSTCFQGPHTALPW